jgi:hypothetical protein
MCGVMGALEYLEWVGETFGAEHTERYAADYTGWRLRFKLGMAAIRSYEFELSHTLLDVLSETPGVKIYGITDTRRLVEQHTRHLINCRRMFSARKWPVAPRRYLRRRHGCCGQVGGGDGDCCPDRGRCAGCDEYYKCQQNSRLETLEHH